jgi:hypothetical protein
MNTTWKHTVAAVTILLAVVATAVSITAPCRADDFLIGPECQIANVTGPAVDLRGQVSITAGAGSYLAVWRDHRGGTQYDIYGGFVDAGGDPLGESFLISCDANGDPTVSSGSHPSAAFNGTNFLVVWDVAPSGIAKIYGARVTPTGQVLDPNGFVISGSSTDDQICPDVASNGTDWEVVWQKNCSTCPTDPSSIFGATVAGATRIVTKQITVANSADAELKPSIASNGLTGTACRYFVAWEDQGYDSDIRGCRIDNNGNKVAGSDTMVSNKVGAPTSGATGAQFGASVAGGKDSTGTLGGWMVSWEDAPLGTDVSTTDVRISRITAAGAVQDAGGTLVFSAYGKYYTSGWNLYYSTPVVGWNGQSYQVICRNAATSRRVYGRTVGFNGATGTTTTLSTSSSSQNGMSIAGGLGTGGCVLVWEYSGSASNVVGCYANTSGVGTTEHVVALSKQDQQQCAAAWDGYRQVVVWADRRYGAQVPYIYAARVRPNGTVDDPQGVTVSPPAYEQTQPAIAWNPVNACYLVVWRQGTGIVGNYDIKGIRLNSNLGPIGSELTICSTDSDRTNPSVAWNGSNFLVVWADNRPLDGTWDIYGVRVSGLGVVASSFTVSNSSGDQVAPSVAAGPSGDWLVAYEDWGTVAGIKSRKVPNSGALGGESTVSTRIATKSEPKVAYGGTNYLIVWSESVTGAYSIRGALMNSSNVRVTADPAGDIVASTGATYRSHPSLTWTGSKYVAVWEDYRNAVTSSCDIYGTRIAAAGTVQDTGGLLVSQSTKAEYGPFIAPVSSDQCLAYYTNLTSSINSLRARTFWIVTPPPPEYWIGDAKQLADGTPVTFAEVVVTAGNDEFSGKFYIEDRSRASGIKIVWSGSTISEGTLVTVSGAMATVDGERQLTATSVNILPRLGVVPGPLGVQPMSMGGAATGIIPGVGVGTYGPSNVGLLVKCWGRVQNPGSGYFELRDPNGRVIRVKSPFTLPTDGMMYAVTGISSCEPVTGGYGSVLLVRKVGDVRSLP